MVTAAAIKSNQGIRVGKSNAIRESGGGPCKNADHVPSRNLSSFEPTSDCQQRWNWDKTIETSSKECICSPRVVGYVDFSRFYTHSQRGACEVYGDCNYNWLNLFWRHFLCLIEFPKMASQILMLYCFDIVVCKQIVPWNSTFVLQPTGKRPKQLGPLFDIRIELG